MKIALFALNSSYIHTNLAVRCLQNALRAAGHTAEILEFALKDRRSDILHALYTADADLYGFSVYIWNVEEMQNTAAALKKLRPGAKIAFGGPEVSFSGEEYLAAHPYIDHLIRGEGEAALTALADGRTQEAIVDGSAYAGFAEAGILYDGAPASSIVYYESSRGCPYRCAFCLSGRKERGVPSVRAKSASRTLEELLEFNRFPQVRIVKLVDRTFNFDRERAKEIWRGLLDDRYRLHYHFEICAELLDEESFALLARMPAGKIQLEIGVQSTNPATLAACCRPSDTPRVIAAARRIHEMGNIHVHCDLIAGLPYESYARFGQSFDDLHGSCTMLQLGFLKLLHGSELRRRAREYGLVFSDTPPYQILSTPDLSYEELFRLERIASLLERLESSGKFPHTTRYIFANAPSPFRFYEAFSDELGRDVSQLSQNALFEALRRFFAQDPLITLPLCLDYLLTNTTPLPGAPRDGILRDAASETYRLRVISDLRARGEVCNAGGLFAFRHEKKPDTVYCVDRIRHILYSEQTAPL